MLKHVKSRLYAQAYKIGIYLGIILGQTLKTTLLVLMVMGISVAAGLGGRVVRG